MQANVQLVIIAMFREFAGLDAAVDYVPDGSAILRFRHLLQAHDLGLQMLTTVNAVLITAKGMLLKQGAVVDATLIAAPSSMKNSTGTRNPEMHQTKKVNQWYFGMKAYAGVDAESGLGSTAWRRHHTGPRIAAWRGNQRLCRLELSGC